MYQLNPALRPFWAAKKRNKILYGGRASSKSHDAAGMAVYLAANYTLKFMCARQFQNRISESVYTLIKDKIENSEFKNEFEFTKNSIHHKITGSSFLFYGIARNLSEIKSTEGVDILWLEEAHYINEEQWSVIEPTIRKEGSQVWIIFNPDELMDYAYQSFVVNPPEDTITREINWQENPYLSRTMLNVIHSAYRKDKKLADHIYGGQPKTGGDKSVISLLYIIAAIDAHKKLGWEPTGAKRTGFDVADDGEDKNAIVDAFGNVAVGAEQWEGLEDKLLESSKRVYNHAEAFGSSVTYDSIGIGAHVGSKFSEINDERSANGDSFKLSYDAFNAGSGVQDPEKVYMVLPHTEILNKHHFANIKAQMWDQVATMFRKTYEAIELGVDHPHDELISLCSESLGEEMIKILKMELSAPRKDVDLTGKFKVESKKDMKEKRKIKSPNVADAFIMAFIKPKRAPGGFFDM